jgi:decaprenylphospho-beta-D-erythro-pentofuranosid-2-ulose 2-reductase
MRTEGRPRPRVLIVGATSALATEVARRYAERGATLVITGRNPARLAAVGDDLRVRGAAEVVTQVLDLFDRAAHADAVKRAFEGDLDVALIAHGDLPDQRRCETDPREAARTLELNLVATVELLTLLAAEFEARRSGTIAVISSVAGDRGRQSNYVYGAAKAGVSVFLQGLRQRLHPAGVRVVTLKPGFVDTPMTAHLPRNPLASSARLAGGAIYRAIEARRDVAYIPWFWRPVMALIRAMPEALFKRLRL